MSRWGGNGFLPYGAADNSIIFRSPLTSLASFTTPEIGSATLSKTGAAGVFDSVLGFNPKGNTYLRILALAGYADLDNAGQISMEVERDWIGNNDPANGSYGTNWPAAESALSISPGTGADDFLIIAAETGTQTYFACTLNGMSYANPDWYKGKKLQTGSPLNGAFVHTAGKSEFITINIGWSGGPAGGEIITMVDGLPYSGDQRSNGTDANLFADIIIGANGAGGANFISNSYVRNLQISNRAPSFRVNRKLAKIAVLSDSLAEIDNFTAVRRDAVTPMEMRRQFMKRGFVAGDIAVSVNGGYSMQDATPGVNHLFSAARLAALQAEKANVVVLRGSTNDVINALLIDAAWDTEIKSYLTTILSWSSTEAVVVVNCPAQSGSGAAYTAARMADVQRINGYFAALPAWNARVYVANAYDALGGDAPADDTYIGQVTGLYDNLHLAGLGHHLHGKCITDTIIDEVLG